jgi:hypothetical protein
VKPGGTTVVFVLVTAVNIVEVLTVEPVTKVVDVETVETAVTVAFAIPLEGKNRSMVARGLVPAIIVWLKSTGVPTVHPLPESII